MDGSAFTDKVALRYVDGEWVEVPKTREERMAISFRTGKTLAEIGAEHGITRERVRQLLKKLGITGNGGGVQARKRKKVASRAASLDEKSMKRYGMTREEIRRAKGTYGRRIVDTYRFHKHNAIGTLKAEWDLLFVDWLACWVASGHMAERGRGRGYYMVRKDRRLPYRVGNIEVIRGSEFQSRVRMEEYAQGRGMIHWARGTGAYA